MNHPPENVTGGAELGGETCGSCNSHAELVEALQKMVAETEMHRDSPTLRYARLVLTKAGAT